jgi:hypothetical protein
MIFATIHPGQQGRDEYSRSVVREDNFCPNSLKIKRARWMICVTSRVLKTLIKVISN